MLDPFFIPSDDGAGEVGVTTFTLPARGSRRQSRHRLVAIRAARDIPAYDVREGDVGGFVDLAFADTVMPEQVLADSGDCWLGQRALLLCHREHQQPGDTIRSFRPALSGDALMEGENDESLVISMGSVGGQAMVKGDNVFIDLNAVVDGHADVGGYAEVKDTAHVTGHARVTDTATIGGGALVNGNARVEDNVFIDGNAVVTDDAFVYGDTIIDGHARVSGQAKVSSEHAAPISMFARGDVAVDTLYKLAIDKHEGQLAVTRVGGQARVTGEAHVSGGVCDDNALISGRAHVTESAVCTGNVVVTGDAHVGHGARLGGGLIEGVVRYEDDDADEPRARRTFITEGHLPSGKEINYPLNYDTDYEPPQLQDLPAELLRQHRDCDEMNVLLSTPLDADASDEELRQAEESERQMIRRVLDASAAAAHDEAERTQMTLGDMICGAVTRARTGERCQHPVVATTRRCPARHRPLRLPASSSR